MASHPALRTAFRWHDVEWPVQEVYANASLPVRQEDWRELGRADQEARLRDFLAADRQEGFDLRTRPLLRLAFFRVGDLDYRIVWTFHHIVIDGRSQLIVLKEVFDLYEALRAGRDGELSPPGLFRDHVTGLASRDRSGDEEFWRARVRDCSEPTSLDSTSDVGACCGNPPLRRVSQGDPRGDHFEAAAPCAAARAHPEHVRPSGVGRAAESLQQQRKRRVWRRPRRSSARGRAESSAPSSTRSRSESAFPRKLPWAHS